MKYCLLGMGIGVVGIWADNKIKLSPAEAEIKYSKETGMSGIILQACSKKNEEKPLRFDRVMSKQNILEGSSRNEGNSFLLTQNSVLKPGLMGPKIVELMEKLRDHAFFGVPFSK